MNFPDIEITTLEKVFESFDTLTFAVLPGSFLDSKHSEMYLSAVTDNKFYVIVEDVKSLDDYMQFRLGSFIKLRKHNDKIKLVEIDILESEKNPEVGLEYNPGKSLKSLVTKKIKFNKGKSTIINGSSNSGKTTYATEIADGFENNGFKTYRLSIGQRRGDSLGDNTITIDSETSESMIMKKLYFILFSIVKKVHEGYECVLVMDSLDKLISLCSITKNNVRRTMFFLDRMIIISGNYREGSFTVIATNDKFHKEQHQRLNSFFKDILDTGMYKKELRNPFY